MVDYGALQLNLWAGLGGTKQKKQDEHLTKEEVNNPVVWSFVGQIPLHVFVIFSWHVLSRNNILKVRKDEAEARRIEEEKAKRAAIAVRLQ